MNTEALKVVEIALKEVGTKEKPVNITKYTAYFEGSDFYNGSKGDGKTWGCEWCDVFVDWCFCQAFGMDLARKKLYQPKRSAGAGCKFSANYYRSKGSFYPYPMPGDQVFFGPNGNESHTGIVTKVTKDRFYTVEGNSGNAVKEHSYTLPSKKVSGFGRPDWSAETPAKPTYVFPTIPARGFFANGDKGPEVKKMQNILLAIKPTCLPRYGADGEIGQETLEAVAEIQRITNIHVDRLYGPKTNKACKLYLDTV